MRRMEARDMNAIILAVPLFLNLSPSLIVRKKTSNDICIRLEWWTAFRTASVSLWRIVAFVANKAEEHNISPATLGTMYAARQFFDIDWRVLLDFIDHGAILPFTLPVTTQH